MLVGWLLLYNYLNNMGKKYVPLGISTILLSKSVLSNIVGISIYSPRLEMLYFNNVCIKLE